MPIFEYRCSQCGRHFEKFVVTQQKAQPSCPVCGSAETKKIISSFATSGRSSVGGSSSCMPSG